MARVLFCHLLLFACAAMQGLQFAHSAAIIENHTSSWTVIPRIQCSSFSLHLSRLLCLDDPTMYSCTDAIKDKWTIVTVRNCIQDSGLTDSLAEAFDLALPDELFNQVLEEALAFERHEKDERAVVICRISS